MYGLGSSVSLATDYRLGIPGIESRWGRDFPPIQAGPGAHPASCTMGTGCSPGVKCGRGVLLTTHPFLVLQSWKNRAIPLPTLWATTMPVTETLHLLHLIWRSPGNQQHYNGRIYFIFSHSVVNILLGVSTYAFCSLSYNGSIASWEVRKLKKCRVAVEYRVVF